MKDQLSKLALAAASLLLATCFSLHATPLKVFILAGQTNMLGYANTSTFDYVKQSPDAAELRDLMIGADGKPASCKRTWISSYSENRDGNSLIKEGKLTTGFGFRNDCIGPEYTFGLAMEQSIDGPILIIKTSWIAKDLYSDFRPPSGGMIDSTKGKRSTQMPSHYYHLMIAHIRRVLDNPAKICPAYNETDGYEIAGFVWFQGSSDMAASAYYPQSNQPDGYSDYTTLLGHLIRDVRNELEVPDLPFVIGVMGIGGKIDLTNPGRFGKAHHNFRQAMAATAKTDEFKNSVTNVFTEDCWDPLQDQASRVSQDVDIRVKAIEKEQGTFTHKVRQKMIMEILKNECTPEIINAIKGMSNHQSHYFGSAKITGCIGKKFAEAMLSLMK